MFFGKDRRLLVQKLKRRLADWAAFRTLPLAGKAAR